MTGQRGAATLPLLGIVVLLVMLTLVLVDLGRYLGARLQAAAAADAAALAAAPVTFRPFGASGTAAAEASHFAEANGARLESCACSHDPTWETREVEVVVSRDVELFVFGGHTVTAASRAEFAPTRLVHPPRGAASDYVGRR